MDWIESFLAHYPSTISAISALATIFAVIAALHISNKQTKPRLKAFADVRLYISSEAQTDRDFIDTEICPQVISVSIDNIGPTAVRIPYFSSFTWKVPLGGRCVWQNPHEPDFRAAPIELRPGASVSIVLSADLENHKRMIEELSTYSRLGKLARHFPRLSVTTEVGGRFQVRLGKSLRKLNRTH